MKEAVRDRQTDRERPTDVQAGKQADRQTSREG